MTLDLNDEKIIDTFLQQGIEQPERTTEPPTTDESLVEQKAREGGDVPVSPVQKKTLLSGSILDERIATDLQKNPHLNEANFKAELEEKKKEGGIAEEDYLAILNSQLAEVEAAQQKGEEKVKPPPVLANTWEGTKQSFNQFSDWATTWKTPGGIAALVWTLLFFIWVIVPVNDGKTRMQLLWGVLTGQYRFTAKARAEEQIAAIPPNYTGEINVPQDEAPYFNRSSTSKTTFDPTSVSFEPETRLL